jgi:hypothetical protein
MELDMTKEYPLDSAIKQTLLFWSFLAIGLRELLILFIVMFDADKTDFVRHLLFILVFVSAIYIVIQAYTEKIVVSPLGITLHLPGLHVLMKWEDVERISRSRTLGVSYEAIFAPKSKAVITGIQSFGIFGEKVSINLFRYSENWRDSELGQQIRQYAPHLFEKPVQPVDQI